MKICVISFSTTDYKIADSTKIINEKYCKHNNYEFVFYNTIPDNLKNRHPAWCKLYYILNMMENNNSYDYVMWIDADAFFCNNKLKIENWIEKSDNKKIIISRDPGYSLEQYMKNPECLNSGVMIFKNCDENKTLLNYMIYDPIFKPNYNFVRSNNPITGITGWDQAAIRYCFINNIHNMKDNTYVNLDTNLNNNTNNVEKYISDGGFIIHLTNFMGKFGGKLLDTINKFNLLILQ